MNVMSIPILTRLLKRSADEAFTSEISAQIWQDVAEQLGYSPEVIAATTIVAIECTTAAAAPAAMQPRRPLPKKALGGYFAAIAATCIVAVACVGGLWIGGVFQQDDYVENVRSTSVHGYIAFSGGEMHFNPAHAAVQAYNEFGDMIARHWWITLADCDEILHSGEGGDVGDTLALMRALGKYNEYALWFLMEDVNGNAYNVKRLFILRPSSD